MMTEKKKKVIAILKQRPADEQTLELYDTLLSLSDQSINGIIKDQGIQVDKIVPQLDLTMELELLKTKK